MNSLPKHQGFDAAIGSRQEDYLNRWPLAREIYGIATTGPNDWSVRVGIYGEWGTGKTSVLEFITAMAKHDGQTVVRFNPWQHSSKDALWLAFVTAIYNQPIFYSMERAGWVRTKKKFTWLLNRGKVAEEGTAVFNETAGKAVGAGLDIVKGWFSFTEDDLKAVRAKLGDKRVIVLIDDLDRTAPELVPEILFALKELMNIPGFSFVCAFDPVVVGQVLGTFHPGFGNGLKFLEKIIDYPRWLPPPTPEGLAKLAIADAKKYCDYVPEGELRDSICLLPQNPRAIRQFIRLISLLKPQIQRHNEDELRWNIILAANVIKIRQPRLAHILLKDEAFWNNIGGVSLMAKEDEEQKELDKAIKAHVGNVALSQGITLTETEQIEIFTAMKRLCSKVNVWFGNSAEVNAYQTDIAEAPHAVTWKEFDEFTIAWERDQTAQNVIAWITGHSAKVERPELDIYLEILTAALQRYANILRQADGVHREEERPPLIQKAKSLISMLECLVLELGQIDKLEKKVGPNEIDQIFETSATILKSSSPILAEFCTRNEVFLKNIIERWMGDPTPLVDAVCPYGYFGSRRFDGPSATALHQRLSSTVLPKLAAQVVDGFRRADFVDRVWTQDAGALQLRCILLAHDGPLWIGARKELLAVLKEAGTNQIVQENAYELLHWFGYLLREQSGTGDTDNLKKLLQEKECLDAIWNSATAKTLSPHATIRLNNLVVSLKKMDVNVDLPPWWETTLKAIAKPQTQEVPTNETN